MARKEPPRPRTAHSYTKRPDFAVENERARRADHEAGQALDRRRAKDREILDMRALINSVVTRIPDKDWNSYSVLKTLIEEVVAAPLELNCIHPLVKYVVGQIPADRSDIALSFQAPVVLDKSVDETFAMQMKPLCHRLRLMLEQVGAAHDHEYGAVCLSGSDLLKKLKPIHEATKESDIQTFWEARERADSHEFWYTNLYRQERGPKASPTR